MRGSLIAGWIVASCVVFGWTEPGHAADQPALHYFPSGSIYEYRWKLLEIALAHAEIALAHAEIAPAHRADSGGPVRLEPYPEDVTQNRGVALVESGAIDVIALGTNEEREAKLLPVRIDILRGIVGFRLLVIRADDQARIAAIDAAALRSRLTFGLNSQWADLPILRANGFTVVASPSHENLFGMLTAGRFDAFPRGLNEARRELAGHQGAFPQLAIERTKALFFPYPVYYWVNRNNSALARRIETGLERALSDGSFRALFEAYHRADLAETGVGGRHVVRLDNPFLPAGTPPPDTSWWWPEEAVTR